MNIDDLIKEALYDAKDECYALSEEEFNFLVAAARRANSLEEFNGRYDEVESIAEDLRTDLQAVQQEAAKWREVAVTMASHFENLLAYADHAPNPVHTAAYPNCAKCRNLAEAKAALANYNALTK